VEIKATHMAVIKSRLRKPVKRKGAVKKDLAKPYNEFKKFAGQQYTGMKVGRSHKWYYDKGEWKERKVTPDEWQISYAVTKSRAGKAPEGSGVPVGTEYHWYILAHQNVRKLNANDYTTSLVGLKFKLAHKRFDKETWSASENAQKRKLIKILQRMITELENEMEPPVKKALTKENESLKKRGSKTQVLKTTVSGDMAGFPKLASNGAAKKKPASASKKKVSV
jgi:hypothetical protein